MKYEVCYFVKEVGYEDGEGQWETYGETDSLEEAEGMYDAMRSVVKVGDYIEDGSHYVDQIAIYERQASGTQEVVTYEF